MKQKLKLITAFMCGAVFFSSVSYAATELKARVTDYKVVVNGKELEKLKAPVSINGSTYLPVRSFAETLGYKVDFKNGVILLDKQEASPTSKPSSTPTSTNAPLPTPTPTPTVTPTPTAAPNNKLELLKAENERHAAEIQKIENSYTKSKDYIDSQINQIRRENNVGYLSTEEYDKKVSNLLNELSGLQSQLNLAMFDDSYEGKAKRKNLQEKIDKIDQEMTDLQQARGAQLQIQALEDTLKTRTEGYYAELKEENEKHQRILNSL